MRIAVIGAGKVGQALGRGWSTAGHDVVYGVRDPDDERYKGLDSMSPQDAVSGSEVVLLAVPWLAVEQLCAELPVGNAVVVDATNPRVRGRNPDLGEESGTEAIARWLGSARVVKAFDTTGAENMADADYGDHRPAMLIAGDEPEAKRVVGGLAEELGFDPIDAGPATAALDLEHVAAIWLRLAGMPGYGRGIAFALLRRASGG